MVLETAVKKIPYLEEADPVASYPAVDTSAASRVEALFVALGFKAAAVGTATVTMTAATSGSVAIAFPAGKFTTAPRIYVSLGSASSAKVIPRATASNVNSGTVFCFTGDGSSVTSTNTVYWLAIEA
ncbi:hypothetical protein [Pimelobacter simplex]|uniref:hypothetical protein n=1 Tax=Nocardioides simplex TaxID=2045 RepID=UPI0021501AA9|nr:hypothetical protein [Pimelobacter simplex]UUW92667.1 hypothetical protein M0M43_14645 [Pimelobacter simplex]UUW96495.1 hypothetical protein M0M48_03280 [Pimelobacter simplex]